MTKYSYYEERAQICDALALDAATSSLADEWRLMALEWRMAAFEAANDCDAPDEQAEPAALARPSP